MLLTKPRRRSANGSAGTAEARFDYLALSSDRETLVCKVSRGRIYELPVQSLRAAEEWDDSGIRSWEVVNGGYGAVVRLNSGASIDFAADFVLHCCEPAYAYYKGKAAPFGIGARVRAMREERGYRLEDLARRSGIAPSNLSRLEHGKHIPTWRTLERIAVAFRIPVLRLISR